MSIAPHTRYDTVAIGIHWLVAGLMIFMLVFGEDLMEVEDYGGTFAPSLHASIGSVILLLTILRLAWRAANPPPAYPTSMASWEKLAAKMTHLIFYVLLIVIPITGWLAIPEFLEDEYIGGNITIFGFPIPLASSVDLSMDDVHEFSSNLTIALLALHVLAALKHHFITRDDILRRMLPRTKSST